jgi:hypothetical protein
VPAGKVMLAILVGGEAIREYSIEVPSDSYELVVD